MPTQTTDAKTLLRAVTEAAQVLASALVALDKTVSPRPAQAAKKPAKAVGNTRITPLLLSRVRKLHSGRLNDVAIGKALGIRPATVKYARSQLGLGGYAGNPTLRRA